MQDGRVTGLSAKPERHAEGLPVFERHGIGRNRTSRARLALNGVAECVRIAGPHLVNVQIDDMCRGVHEHLEFGEGEIDFPPVLAALTRVAGLAWPPQVDWPLLRLC